jgi:hypothetical protein
MTIALIPLVRLMMPQSLARSIGALAKNRVVMNGACDSLNGICRKGREVLRPPGSS